ncbi:MAG: HD domain-containing protein [Erysipelotrichaceae bacterium]|nr:HD domain-containing protein [Erysipelotrichaceae bacterium]
MSYTTEIDLLLQTYISEKILPVYETYESSHDRSHIETVIRNSLELAKVHDVDINMVFTIAAYHDIGLPQGRENHEITSGRYLYEDKNLRHWFSEEEILLMKEAVEDHRASRRERPRSIYGCIVAEADRDIKPERILERCAEYEKAHHPGSSREDVIKACVEHIHEKYGRNGYLKLWISSKRNEEGLEKIRSWIDDGSLSERLSVYL